MKPLDILDDIIIITAIGTITFISDRVLEKMQKPKMQSALNTTVELGAIGYVIVKGLGLIREVGREFYL